MLIFLFRGSIHNFHHIKTSVFKQSNSLKLADNIRPYGVAVFIKFVLTYTLYYYLRASDERSYQIVSPISSYLTKPSDLRVVIFLHGFMQNTGHKGLNLFLKIALFYAFFCCFGAISGGFSTLVTTGVMIWTSANT